MAGLSQVLLFVVGLLMILIILLQRGRGGGLAGAFGGMGGQSAFGTRAGDVFTRITGTLAVTWVLLAGGSGWLIHKSANAISDSDEYQSREALGRLEAGKDDKTTGTTPPGGNLPINLEHLLGNDPPSSTPVTNPAIPAAEAPVTPEEEAAPATPPDPAATPEATPPAATTPPEAAASDATPASETPAATTPGEAPAAEAPATPPASDEAASIPPPAEAPAAPSDNP